MSKQILGRQRRSGAPGLLQLLHLAPAHTPGCVSRVCVPRATVVWRLPPLTQGSCSMAAPGWGRWVLGLGPLLLQVFLPFQLVAGRWGPEGAGRGVRRGEPGLRGAVWGVRPRSGRRGSERAECAGLGPRGGRGSSTPVPGGCSRHGKPCSRGRLYSSPGGLE